jgi:hypothetical protein
MAQSFNLTPYFDDFDANNDYYRVLFRPGVAVQVRELNQLQSILQNQITNVGDHLFKEGSMVIPGNVQYNDKLNYIKIQTTSLGTSDLSYLEDKFLSTASDGTGVVARVLKTIAATAAGDPITLVVLYTSSNESLSGLTDKTFTANQTLYVTDDNAKTVITANGTGISGRSALAFINDGVYYLANHFVTISTTSVVVKKYADTLTDINVRIGVQYTESLVTADDDSSLYDNATGSPNYSAPGAHRYKITPAFVQVGLDDSPERFFELIRIESGVLQEIVNGSQYNILQETLARRTFDESGNYVVDDFKFDIREARNNARGAWAASQTYLPNDYVYSNVSSATTRYFECVQGGVSSGTEPASLSNTSIDETTTVSDGSVVWRYTANPIGNRGLSTTGSSSNLVAAFGVGKAYIGGFEILKTINSNVTLPKSRDTKSDNNRSIPLNQGNYVYVNKNFAFGIPDISTIPPVDLFDRVVGNRNIQKFGYGQKVGTARINWVEPDARGGLKVSLSDIIMKSGKGFDRDVNSIIVNDTTTSITQTSYTLTGTVKYAGNTTSTFLQIGGFAQMASTGISSTFITVTGTLCNYLAEVSTGDLITFGTSSFGTTAGSSWTVIGVNGVSSLTVAGGPITGSLTTSIFVRFAAQTVFGHATSVAAVSTRFQSEYRPGDTIWMGPSASNTVTGTVVSVINENRMIVSSNLSAYIAGTSHGTYYAGRTATFAADVWGNYQIGINARKLTGNFQLLDYTGGTTVAAAHSALRIQGSNDAKMLSELAPNDLVDINGQRLFVTKISSNTVAYGINLDLATVSGNSTQFPAFRVNNNLNETSSNTLIFPVTAATSSIVDNLYTVYKSYSVSGISGFSSVTVTLASASGNAAAEALATTDINAYFISQDIISNLSTPMPIYSVNQIGQNVTITCSGNFSSNTAKVIIPVTRGSVNGTVLGNVKSKTYTPSVYDDFLGTSSASRTRLPLSKNDILKIVKIFQATSFVTSWDSITQAAATDVTSRYDLDTGQRDCFYDFGAVSLRPGFPPPTGSIRVYYDYFTHGTGDFFARSSYNALTHPYEKIPSYKGNNLGDMLDFRPRISDSLTNLGTGNAPPRFATNFVADISYYLGRKHSIILDKSAAFYSVSGVSSTTPDFPKITNSINAVKLYDVEFKPYTSSSNSPDVFYTKYDNRRFTMKDIGNVEKRVSGLEFATSLSLLEAKTKNLQIRDNLDNTLERYKTGFFVDNFSDLSNAELTGDARFNLNQFTQTIEPAGQVNSLPLSEKVNYTASLYTSSELTGLRSARDTQNYAVTGDLLTLKYTTSTVLSQLIATTSIAVAPFLTATFLGNLKLIPETDIFEQINYNTNIVGSSTASIAISTNGGWSRYIGTTVEEVLTQVGSTKVSNALLPYCRANTILWRATGLKPNTKYYTFFDGQHVENYMTGAVKLTFDSMPFLEFDATRANSANEFPRYRSEYTSLDIKEVTRAYQVGAGANATWAYDYGWFHRTVNPKDYETYMPSAATRDTFRIALGGGPCVYYYEGTGASRALVGSAVAAWQDSTTLYLVNARGKLSPSFIRSQGSYNYSSGQFYVGIDGSEVKRVNATVTVASALTQDTSGYLYSDAKGTVIAVSDLPNADTIKFLAGKKPVVITDNANNDPDDWTAKAEAQFYGQGTDVTVTNNYISTKTYVARYYDPIAQTFRLPDQYTSGAFISDIDFYFQQKPLTEKAPIHLDIRICDEGGRPSANELVPGAAVTLFPDDITTDSTGQTATKFKFAQPIYLMPGKQYGIVLRCDTKNYRVWMATMGQSDVYTPSTNYSSQALYGSLFKSQDGTLWTEDQMSDLKFRINRCVFSTADTGARAWVVNNGLGAEQLPNNPLTFEHGSSKIRVGHRNHGFASGDTTRLFSSYWAGQYALNSLTSINGIPVGEIFGTYVSSTLTTYRGAASDPVLTISDVTLDTYTVSVSSVANLGAAAVTGVTTTIGGGNDLQGFRQIQYQVVKPRARTLQFQPTTLAFTGKMLNGVTYDYDAAAPSSPYNWYTRSLNLNADNYLDSSVAILSDLNENSRVNTSISITAGGSSQVWKNSFIGYFDLYSSSDAVSPAVDLGTLNLDTKTYRIDNPNYTNRIGTLAAVSTSVLSIVDTIVSSNATVTFDGNFKTINTTVEGLFNNVIPGRYITVSGSSVSANNITSTGVLVTGVINNGKTITVSSSAIATSTTSDNIIIRQYNDYTEELTTLTGGTEAKFITKVIGLKNPASQIKLIVETCVPNAADFDVYYKIGATATDFNTVTWNRFVAPNQPNTLSSYATIVKSDVRNVFTDVEFNISGFDATGTPVDLTQFTAFQVKLVMRSSNAARVPQFRNLRVIAHA